MIVPAEYSEVDRELPTVDFLSLAIAVLIGTAGLVVLYWNPDQRSIERLGVAGGLLASAFYLTYRALRQRRVNQDLFAERVRAVYRGDRAEVDEWDDPEDRAAPVTPLRSLTMLSTAVLGAAVFGGLGFVVLDIVPTALVPRTDSLPSTAQSVAFERSSIRTAGLGVLAAFGAALGLLMTWHGHRHQAQEAARVERDRARARRHARQSLTFGRFNDAIKQLAEIDSDGAAPDGSASRVTVRLAGVYSLGTVAMESRQQRPAVRDVLTAFVADHQEQHRRLDLEIARLAELGDADWEATEAHEAKKRAAAASPDVSAALVVLARIHGQAKRHSYVKLSFAHADLAGANLSDSDLRGADLRHADLTDADLFNADLTDALLSDAVLTGADCREAEFCRADLSRAVLTDADLRSSNLEGVDWTEASVEGANFDGVARSPELAQLIAAASEKRFSLAEKEDEPASPVGSLAAPPRP